MIRNLETGRLDEWVNAARQGDRHACEHLVRETQARSLAAAYGVLRDAAAAQDAVQLAYLRAFRRLHELREPAAFGGWLRRIVITAALNLRRAHRHSHACLDDMPEMPVLDDAEDRWSGEQRQRLSVALLSLGSEERRTCDRHYHGGWSMARLAAAAGIDELAMRKRMQRIRQKLRKLLEQEEIQMAKNSGIDPERLVADLPHRVAELLARPQLTDLPENPVGRMLEALREVFHDFMPVELPEIVDLASAGDIASVALYLEPTELHRIDGDRILRYDLTLPLLLNVRHQGGPLKVCASGKTYRAGKNDATHLEAFHQFEALWLDDAPRVDQWQMTTRVLKSVERVLPGRAVKIVPSAYPMCSSAWDLEVEQDGRWSEVLAWGVFTDSIVRQLGGDPARHAAVGVGYGLERLAMLRYGIDDIRKIDMARVA